jgi:hypothetical protein
MLVVSTVVCRANAEILLGRRQCLIFAQGHPDVLQAVTEGVDRAICVFYVLYRVPDYADCFAERSVSSQPAHRIFLFFAVNTRHSFGVLSLSPVD